MPNFHHLNLMINLPPFRFKLSARISYIKLNNRSRTRRGVPSTEHRVRDSIWIVSTSFYREFHLIAFQLIRFGWQQPAGRPVRLQDNQDYEYFHYSLVARSHVGGIRVSLRLCVASAPENRWGSNSSIQKLEPCGLTWQDEMLGDDYCLWCSFTDFIKLCAPHSSDIHLIFSRFCDVELIFRSHSSFNSHLLVLKCLHFPLRKNCY